MGSQEQVRDLLARAKYSTNVGSLALDFKGFKGSIAGL